MGLSIECPFYIKHKFESSSIVCEDCSREFYTREARHAQLLNVCKTNWKTCPHAIALLELYERTDGMNLTAKEKEHLQHTCEQQKDELKRIRIRYKHAKKTIEEKERDLRAMEYLADSRDKQVKKLQDQVTLLQEKERGLLALIGTLSIKSGIDDFTLWQVRRYAKEYRTLCTVNQDGEVNRVKIEHLRLEDDAKDE